MTRVTARRNRVVCLAVVSAIVLALGVRAQEEDTVTADAFTIPYRSLEIATEIGSVIAKVHVEEGDTVTQDQVLVELKSDVFRAQAAVSRSRVELAEQELAAYERTCETRVKEFDRIAKLSRGTVSEEDYDKARLERDMAVLGLERARTQKRTYELAAILDEEQVKRTIIRAPCNGRILRVIRRPGEAVEEQRPVLNLVRNDPLFVIAFLPLTTCGRVPVGSKAMLALETMPETPLECVVAVVDNVADVGSGKYRVKLTLANPDEKITAGAKGLITFKLCPR